MGSSVQRYEVVTAKKIAEQYNSGLEQAIETVHARNERVSRELVAANVPVKRIAKSLLPVPKRCPVLDARFCRRWLKAFEWRRAARNTSGQYLAAWLC